MLWRGEPSVWLCWSGYALAGRQSSLGSCLPERHSWQKYVGSRAYAGELFAQGPQALGDLGVDGEGAGADDTRGTPEAGWAPHRSPGMWHHRGLKLLSHSGNPTKKELIKRRTAEGLRKAEERRSRCICIPSALLRLSNSFPIPWPTPIRG